jgi:hypothetical protein
VSLQPYTDTFAALWSAYFPTPPSTMRAISDVGTNTLRDMRIVFSSPLAASLRSVSRLTCNSSAARPKLTNCVANRATSSAKFLLTHAHKFTKLSCASLIKSTHKLA